MSLNSMLKCFFHPFVDAFAGMGCSDCYIGMYVGRYAQGQLA